MRVELKFCYGHDQACRLEELLDNQTSEQLSPNQYQLFWYVNQNSSYKLYGLLKYVIKLK